MNAFSKRLAVVGVALVAVGGLAPRGPAQDVNPLHKRQQAQEGARSLALDLVSAVLDLQLRQLEENGLAKLPIYRDVQTMRANVAGLVAEEMNDVVRLLAEAQAAPAATAEGKWKEARQAIRDVVAELMAERQKLHRRMHVSRLSAQAREVVGLLQKTSELTRSLDSLAAGERERRALAAIEGQADVRELYLQLCSGLTDVSHWGGEPAAGALDGLRIVRVYEVENQLERASSELMKANSAAAVAGQAAALAGLAALVERLERMQGIADVDREAALRLVQELIARQRLLREQCQGTALSERTAPPLVEHQTALHKELGKLPQALAKYPASAPLCEEAKAASFEATAKLFEAQQSATLEQQGRVITNLAQIARLLEQQLDSSQGGRSADEWAAEIEKLSSLADLLSEGAAGTIAATTVMERAKELGDLPSIVQARLDEVAEKVTADEAVMMAAIRRAEAEVAMELADARRKQKAVELGELARGAEALERASAAERTIARQMQKTPDHERLLLLAEEHTEVVAVAERIAVGVGNTAPQARSQFAEVQKTLSEGSGLFEHAVAESATAKEKLKNLSGRAQQAAQQLVEAAALLRTAQGAAAKQLESIAGEQLGSATEAREAVGEKLDVAKDVGGEALAHLLEARWFLGDAVANQARAEGKAAEAEARLALREISDLLARQQQADDAAQELASGAAMSPLDAASLQQEVSAGARKLAASSTGELRERLDAAATSAGEAGRLALAGMPSQNAARATANEALRGALDAARKRLSSGSDASGGPASKQAQVQVADDLDAAQQSAEDAGLAGVEGAGLLEKARSHAIAAAKQFESADRLVSEQSSTRRFLSEAGEALDQAIAKITLQQASRLATRLEAVSGLIEQAAKVDAGAAAAIAQAIANAERGGAPDADAERVSRSLARVQSKLEQATANLAAREQQLKRDRDLAHLLAEFAEDQQDARDAIVQAAEELDRMAQADSTQRTMAAQALLAAQQRFVQSMIATGEGAAAVSGQEDVANQPIREGLEIASRLGGAGEQAEGQEAGDAASSDKSSGDKQPGEGKQGDGKSGNAANADSRFVPAQPQITAQQIAGPAANAQAAQAMAEAMKGMGQGVPGEGQGETESSQEGATAAAAKKGGATKGKQTAKNEAPPQGDLEASEAADSDSRATGAGEDAVTGGANGLAKEAWFARLPAEIRSAIQARARAKAPRGYEERLRRYFESVD